MKLIPYIIIILPVTAFLLYLANFLVVAFNVQVDASYWLLGCVMGAISVILSQE